MRKMTLTLCSTLVVLLAQSASAQIRIYQAFMDGPSENPPNASPGTGTALVTFDLSGTPMMRVEADFSGLISPTTLAHIHCCGDPSSPATTTPTFPGFPAGVTSGSYDQTFDMTLASSYNPAFVTANGGTTASALSALLAGLDAGQAYFNIHTSQFPGGEIRGFLTFIPEPSTGLLAGFALAGLLLRRRR